MSLSVSPGPRLYRAHPGLVMASLVMAWCRFASSVHRRPVTTPVARIPQVFPTPTGRAASLIVRPSYSPMIPNASLVHRIIGTDVPPWWLVHQHEQRNRSHRVASNHCQGFCLDSAVPVGSLVGLVFRPVGWRRCVVLVGVAPSSMVASGIGSLWRWICVRCSMQSESLVQ
jgi:hypothetical protein